jgi:hypothetical protein
LGRAGTENANIDETVIHHNHSKEWKKEEDTDMFDCLHDFERTKQANGTTTTCYFSTTIW